MEVVIAWALAGVAGWVAFGIAGRSRLFNPFDAWDFYVLILPLFLLMPPAGIVAAVIVSFQSKD